MRGSSGEDATTGRMLAIGDIHGCIRALDRLLDQVGPTAADVLIFLGDYVGKGPDSASVLERMIQLQARYRIQALLGNHDEMMLTAAAKGFVDSQWVPASRATTLDSYPNGHVPPAHVAFLRSCSDGFETANHIFVHANLEPDLPLAQQPAEALRWKRLDERQGAHVSGKVMVCGHAAQKSGDPFCTEHAICIDTFCWGGGWLSCLDVESGRIWQATQSGDARVIQLDDCRRENVCPYLSDPRFRTTSGLNSRV